MDGTTMGQCLAAHGGGCLISDNDDTVNVETDQIRCKSWESIRLSFRIPVLDHDVFPLNVTMFA